VTPLVLIALFVAAVTATLLAFQAGLRLGRWRRGKPDPEQLLPVRVLVVSTMGLLTFILGFTFGLASSHFDSRSAAVFDEAVAIGTAYRRADLLPDPERATVRQLIRDYVDLRVDASRSRLDDEVVARLRQSREQIWDAALAASRKSQSAGPLMQSLTEVIDVHGERVLDNIRARIPFRVWLVLNGIMIVSVAAAGYHAGLAGTERSIAAVAYALVFAAVIVMIAAGDNPGPEQLQTTHHALMDLRARLTAP
jgi:hypothetical protein